MKNSASSNVMPMAAKTTANLSPVLSTLRLAGDLRGEARVRQAGAGEDGQLLPADERVEQVDGGDARLDELVGIVAGDRGSSGCR